MSPRSAPHVRQTERWDCGVACALMALRSPLCGERDHTLATLKRELHDTQGSVWSIDLAHLLARQGVRCTLCTITVGVNADYSEEAFYREAISRDRERVLRLFTKEACDAAGVRVQQVRVPLSSHTDMSI